MTQQSFAILTHTSTRAISKFRPYRTRRTLPTCRVQGALLMMPRKPVREMSNTLLTWTPFKCGENRWRYCKETGFSMAFPGGGSRSLLSAKKT